MTESDTDTQIRRFWASRERLIPEDLLQRLEERFPEFRDAVESSPVRAAEFLCHLDLDNPRLQTISGRSGDHVQCDGK